MSQRPRLSVIICMYNMAREAPRTVLSAACPYQQGIDIGDYEVIVVDNGSTQPLGAVDRKNLPPGVTVHSAPTPQPSPVFALNWAAKELARGDIFLFAIDGARILSNRLYAANLEAHSLVTGAFVYTLGWHLGPKMQRISITQGYKQAIEDALIAKSGWPEKPRALFGISVLAGSSRKGYFAPLRESNAFSVTRNTYESVGGFDERFVSPGGGFANLEIFSRYVSRPGAVNICLLSEGTFHQVHGGTATSNTLSRESFQEGYRAIFGEEYSPPHFETLFYCGEEMEFLESIKGSREWRKRKKQLREESARKAGGLGVL